MHQRVRVGTVAELQAGSRRLIEVNGRSVGLFATHEGYFAVRNHCPHDGAPLCLGRLAGTPVSPRGREMVYDKEDRVLSCPWHHWEFDITTGTSLVNDAMRARTYVVEVDGGEVFVLSRPRAAGRETDDES